MLEFMAACKASDRHITAKLRGSRIAAFAPDLQSLCRDLDFSAAEVQAVAGSGIDLDMLRQLPQADARWLVLQGLHGIFSPIWFIHIYIYRPYLHIGGYLASP